MIQSGGSLPNQTSINNFVNFVNDLIFVNLESYSKALDNIDTEKNIIIMRKIFLQIQKLIQLVKKMFWKNISRITLTNNEKTILWE